jgi:hypothetical protein
LKRALSLLLLLLSSCRSDKPPLIEPICILDGFGGGDCVMSDGSQRYMSPSELKNHWATSQTSQANFAAWCYGVPPKTANAALEVIKRSTLPAGE